MRVKTTLSGAVAALVVGGLVVLAPAAAWGETPAKASVARALTYAPKGTIGILHVNVKAAGKAAVEELAKAGVIGQDTAKALLPVLGKIESAEVYVVGTEGEPVTLIVLRGRITGADVTKIAKVFDLPPSKKYPNGRYGPVLNGRLPDQAARRFPFVVLGNEATDLPAGVSLISRLPLLQPEFFKTLGQQKNDKLVGLLKGVDTTAQVWGAVDLGTFRSETFRLGTFRGANQPRLVKGSLHLVTKGRSKIEMVFENAGLVRETAKDLGNPLGMGKLLRKSTDIKVNGQRLVITSKTTDPILSELMVGYVRARTLAKRAVSMLNLKAIGTGIAMYVHFQANNTWPPDLETLVKAKQPSKLFVSPSSGRELPYDAKGTFRSDYIYIKGIDSSAPGGLIVVYEPPELNKFEQVLALRVDDRYRFASRASKMTPLEFKREIERTEKWFKENGKTFTMDPKTRAWLKSVGKEPAKP